MKIAITGKGGSGKTTLAAGLSLLYSQKGKRVFAVDCDPDMNLGFALGFPHPEKITPISEMKDLISERTEADLDKPAGYFKLNPQVDDIPQKFCPRSNNIHLIVMGKVNKAGGGCLCPENVFIKRLVSHLVSSREEIVILDMVAGTEHLGRGTAESVEAFLIVTEPTLLGISTGLHIKSLAADLGIKKVFFIGNKINNPKDIEFLKDNLKDNLTGYVSFNKTLADGRGRFIFDGQLTKEFSRLVDSLDAAGSRW